jgi:hypothetical protein
MQCGVQLSLRPDGLPAGHVDHHRHDAVWLHVSRYTCTDGCADTGANTGADTQTHTGANASANTNADVWLLSDTRQQRSN